MNGRYDRWTMTPDGKEKNFVTEAVDSDIWMFADNQHARGKRVVWQSGMELVMREGEEEEIVGHPKRIVITGFDVDTVGVRGGITVLARVVESSPLSRGSFDVGKDVRFDSELARGAYQIPVRTAALAS